MDDRGLTVGRLMEVSDETLALMAAQIQDEAARRKLTFEVLDVHPGNATPAGMPTPTLIRVMKALPTLPPADIAKLDTLILGWCAARQTEGR